MRVLILGATGSIGFPVAQAFVRAGHVVYGLVRSEEKVRQFAVEEIIPIVGDASNTSTWTPLIATIDVVVEAVGGSANIKELGDSVLAAVVEAAQTLRPPHTPKITYIYTSGAWVHGSNRTDIISDTTPITSPAGLVAWRPALEQRVVTNPTISGIVIRPGLVYGRAGSITAMLFRNAYEGKVKWFGSPSDRYPCIHTDDLADLYLRAAEKGALVGGQIFDAANDFSENAEDILRKLTEVSGASLPYEWIQPSNPFEVALTTTMRLRPYLAHTLLGWQPRKAGFVDNMEVYYDAWKSTV